MKSSDLFVKCLENEGVEYVFGVPGEENLDVIESLRTSKIKLIVTRHEQVAAFMAATYGRLTGKAGVCLSTLGPGATNLVTGIAYAYLGGMPIVAITGQKGVRENYQGNFQIIDIVNIFKPITKWNIQLISPRTIPRFVRYAFKTAEEERPGPTHIELPEDIADEQLDESYVPLENDKIRRSAPDPKALQLAIELIQKSKCPIIIVSSGANRKRISKQLKNFVDKTGIFVVHTQMGKGVLSDEDEHSLFSMGIHRKDLIHCAIEMADLVITIGYNIVEYPPSVWNKAKEKKILHIDFVTAEPDEYYNPSLELIGDVSHSLWALYDQINSIDVQNAHYDFSYFKKVRAKLLQVQQEYKDDKHFPMKPQKIVFDVRQVMGKEDIVSLDNGIYKIWFARLYPTYAENTLLLDNALASMGAGMPAAMAAKLIYPEKKVLAVCGDGGFMMNSQDLETAIRCNLNIVILLLRDDAYGFIRWKQQGMGFTDFGMTFGNPDFVKYAEAYGAIGYRVEKAEQLLPTLQKAFAQNKPVIIDCQIDYSENKKLTTELGENVCELI